MFDRALVISCAKELDRLLQLYAPSDKEASLLQHDVEEPLTKALSGQLSTPLGFYDVPGDRLILDGSLMTTHRDLTDAFMRFKNAATDKSM